MDSVRIHPDSPRLIQTQPDSARTQPGLSQTQPDSARLGQIQPDSAKMIGFCHFTVKTDRLGLNNKQFIDIQQYLS